MASTVPVVNVEDDDDFDWEAAVREIDMACEATMASTSCPVEENKKKPRSSRQSTLDKFIGKSTSEEKNWSDRSKIESDEKACAIDIDTEAAKTWIYPVNIPLRDYQLSITKTALFSNTLVALPTGLGKTLIAAVVMYNYFRWFPEGKIVFAAPSRPLVMQQIEACHNIVGIPQEWTIDMTGQMSPANRPHFWKVKRVFFVTPQVLDRDIQSGTCMVKDLVCLVIDEAHRALGNYSYCVAVRKLMAVPIQLRILALTATPGSKQQSIQNVIDNLHISTLEYRDESDHDVSSYVHNRQLEVIAVPMGQDADDIDNALVEMIRPFVGRLCADGVLQNGDYQTLSPCQLLKSRDKFRQAPPPGLHMKSGDIEGYLAVLITLYHIRKLLSSHGIRPAYEMLEEKSKQGYFARLLTRNQHFQKAKDRMQKSVTHGAPTPKISKMIEVLIDHFKTNNPQGSRVIIFSNFRGSVRDIMNALGSIGECVRATEFIGQSSGKASRGQSQKVQQAVLEKFRTGGYNVIVATSVGEEGLDIMEVGLVICFDANISSLRMIQRMGRTGRKHDGRVVVLACEGFELKGYMQKQAKSKTLRKHMQNGGLNSFKFHSSPRMIPHIFKPEVQFVELSIEQFVRHGRKIKDDSPYQTHMSRDKLREAESNLIKKYFHPKEENRLRLSLIAFPHFQAFPSRVHRVMHSFRTGILIDAMQHLQGISYSQDGRASFVEDEDPSGPCTRGTVQQHLTDKTDLRILHDSPEPQSERNMVHSDLSPTEISQDEDKHNMPDLKDQNPPTHSYLFGSDFVSVDALGKVLILSIPTFPMKPNSKCTNISNAVLSNSCCDLKVIKGCYKEVISQAKNVADFIVSAHPQYKDSKNVLLSGLCSSDVQQGGSLDGIQKIPHPPKVSLSNEGESLDRTPTIVENKLVTQVDDLNTDFRDTELSPRLTNLVKSGVVPESPLGLSEIRRKDEFLVPDVSPARLETELLQKSLSPGKKELVSADSIFCGRDNLASLVNDEVQSPFVKMYDSPNVGGVASTSMMFEDIHTPVANVTNNSCSKDWHLSSGDEPKSVEQGCKFKRLRRAGDSCKRSMECNSALSRANLARSCNNSSSFPNKHGRGIEKPVDVRTFIEEEAEVSSEACVSDDEEDEVDNSFDDSFIDDRSNPTAASTQAEAARIDMMAVYRRSLLSQSPMERQSDCSTDNITPESVAAISRLSGTGSSSGQTACSRQTPQTEFHNQHAGTNSSFCPTNLDTIPSEAMPCKRSRSPTGGERMENPKRRLSFHQVGYVPAVNLDRKFTVQAEAAIAESSMQHQAEKTEATGDLFYDDDFYEGLDLDAVEAQATMLLRQKSELLNHKQEKPSELTPQNLGLVDSPSFDLGI